MHFKSFKLTCKTLASFMVSCNKPLFFAVYCYPCNKICEYIPILVYWPIHSFINKMDTSIRNRAENSSDKVLLT